MLDRTFAAEFLKTVDDSAAHGVHILFNQFWQYASPEVRAKLVAKITADPVKKAWLDECWYPEPYSFDGLASLPAGSLGRAYYRHIVDNNLNREIATGYRTFHEHLERTGVLADMPDAIKYSVLRGFQTHDLQHMITGYDTTGSGEIALQAFNAAQTGSLYNAMWIAVTATQAAFLNPDMNPGLMDAITEGWSLGRAVKTDLSIVKWELRLGEQIGDLRREFGIPDHPMMLKLAA